MSEIPDFQIAISDFRQFLDREGHADKLVWVFRDDLWFRGTDDVLMLYPPPSGNMFLAEKVYDEGRERGLIEIKAIATTQNYVAATVWFPKMAGEEVQGWSQGLKLTIRQPLPIARVVGSMKWRIVRFMPGYRWYQQHDGFIAPRRWAAA